MFKIHGHEITAPIKLSWLTHPLISKLVSIMSDTKVQVNAVAIIKLLAGLTLLVPVRLCLCGDGKPGCGGGRS